MKRVKATILQIRDGLAAYRALLLWKGLRNAEAIYGCVCVAWVNVYEGQVFHFEARNCYRRPGSLEIIVSLVMPVQWYIQQLPLSTEHLVVPSLD